MDQPIDLIPLEKAAKQIGVSRATLWRRVKEWGLTVYANPLDRRERLLCWFELQEATKPRPLTAPAAKGKAETAA